MTPSLARVSGLVHRREVQRSSIPSGKRCASPVRNGQAVAPLPEALVHAQADLEDVPQYRGPLRSLWFDLTAAYSANRRVRSPDQLLGANPKSLRCGPRSGGVQMKSTRLLSTCGPRIPRPRRVERSQTIPVRGPWRVLLTMTLCPVGIWWMCVHQGPANGLYDGHPQRLGTEVEPCW